MPYMSQTAIYQARRTVTLTHIREAADRLHTALDTSVTFHRGEDCRENYRKRATFDLTHWVARLAEIDSMEADT